MALKYFFVSLGSLVVAFGRVTVFAAEPLERMDKRIPVALFPQVIETSLRFY